MDLNSQLHYVRAEAWWRSQTVLYGDAATAFHPTAGMGASSAMDSAAALGDELSRADSKYLPYVFARSSVASAT